jgi:hypothetical protein
VNSLATFSFIWGILVAVLWLVIGFLSVAAAWRAMRAHERLAEAVERLAERRDRDG